MLSFVIRFFLPLEPPNEIDAGGERKLTNYT